jgi:RNA polymerase sigma-70 factor (ECF subfamily)
VDAVTPEYDAIRDAIRTAVQTAVAGLPERYRVCIDLFFFYERSYQEIEAITGYPVNTIKSHVFRAKKLLREQLADFAEGGIA